MNPQISNIIIMLVMMQLSRRLDMEDPTIIMYIRILYCSSIAISWMVYQMARKRIVAKNDMTTMKYVVPGNSMSGEAEKLEVTTVKDYDLKEIDSAIKSIYTGLAMMGFMHLYMKYTNPLFMQIISPVKGAFENNQVKIHLFGKPAVGDLKRPFNAGGMMAAFSSNAVKTDKKSVADAERAGNGGFKKDN